MSSYMRKIQFRYKNSRNSTICITNCITHQSCRILAQFGFFCLDGSQRPSGWPACILTLKLMFFSSRFWWSVFEQSTLWILVCTLLKICFGVFFFKDLSATKSVWERVIFGNDSLAINIASLPQLGLNFVGFFVRSLLLFGCPTFRGLG